MTDSIRIECIMFNKDDSYSFKTGREQVKKVTVVSNGFTCEMTADQFFKIIHEAHQW